MPDVVTIDQIRDLIKAEKFKPSDLFGADLLADDPSVRGLVETETRRAVAGEYAHRKRTEEGFDKTKAEWEAKLQEKDAALSAMRLEAAKGKVGQLYEAQKSSRKLSAKQAAYIEGRLAKFAPSNPDELEKELNAYLDSEIDEYGKVAKLLGVETDAAPDQGNDKSGGKGTEPEGGKPDGKGPDAPYLDPAKNPFIKLD